MSRINIEPDNGDGFGTANLRLATYDTRAERLETRITELDTVHLIETNRIDDLMTIVRERFRNILKKT